MLHYRDPSTTRCIIPVKTGVSRSSKDILLLHCTATAFVNPSGRLPFHTKIPVHPTIKMEMIKSPLTLMYFLL